VFALPDVAGDQISTGVQIPHSATNAPELYSTFHAAVGFDEKIQRLTFRLLPIRSASKVHAFSSQMLFIK
jgi:hypothetical protein